MSNRHTSELPDSVFGCADVYPGDPRRLTVSLTTDTGSPMIHAHIGPMHIAMTELNWRVVFKAIETLEIPAPIRTFRLEFDDTDTTAAIRLTDSEVSA